MYISRVITLTIESRRLLISEAAALVLCIYKEYRPVAYRQHDVEIDIPNLASWEFGPPKWIRLSH